MPRFNKRTRIDAPAAVVFDWHKRRGALERLLPPWEQVEVGERTGGIGDGGRVTLRTKIGPTWTRWVVEHRDYVEGAQFRDVQISGPFRRWVHTHRVEADGPDACVLEDDIVYELPLGPVGRMLGGGKVESKLRRMFEYRHAVTRADIERQLAYDGRQRSRVLVSGSSGLIGSTLVPLLTTGGHDAVCLQRRATATGNATARWDTETGEIEYSDEQPIDVVVHLAGESIDGRWTDAKKERIRASRLNGTSQIATWIRGRDRTPRLLVCASAVGWYGNRGDEVLTEQSVAGEGLLADVCQRWEEAAQKARSDDTRVVCLRFGMVLSPRGGALSKMLTPFKMGAGGVVGDGAQYWSWISVDDAAGAILHAIYSDELDGAVNVVSPNPVTNREFTKTLGAVLHRPTILPLPGFAARMALGEMADELLLASARVQPDRLLASDYSFRQPELRGALEHLLGV